MPELMHSSLFFNLNTNESRLTGLMEHYCICKKSCIKHFVPPEGAV